MVQFWKMEYFSRKLVYLGKNSQKLFLQMATAQRAWNLTLEMHNLRSEGKLPFVWTAPYGNGKLPLVWTAPQHTVWQRKLTHVWIVPQRTVWQQKVAPCLNGATAHCNQSSEWRSQPNSWIQRRQRWSKPLHGHSRIWSVLWLDFGLKLPTYP